jgi:hypothetical protein
VLPVAAGVATVLLVVAQFVPVDTSNPPVTAEIDAPADVKGILERSCYDCHSNETTWPWYSRVAPVSWLVAHDVEEAREHLNFSEWDQLSTEDQLEGIEEAWEEVEEGEMPLWFYLPLHPEARLSATDREVLKRWATSEAGAAQGGH